MANIEELKNAQTDHEILEYYAKRLSDIDGYYISEFCFYEDYAIVYFVNTDMVAYVSVFVRRDSRGSGAYLKAYYARGLGLPIITIEDCGLVQFLKAKDIPFVLA